MSNRLPRLVSLLGQLRWLLIRPSIRESLFQAEIACRLKVPYATGDLPNRIPSDCNPGTVPDIDESGYRRIMAKLHYGEPTANPEYEAMLTDQEREYLDAYLIQSRWAEFLTKEMRRGFGKYN